MKNEDYQSSSFDIANEFPLTLAETYSDADLKSALAGTVSGLMPGMEKYVNASIAKYTGKLMPKRNQTNVGSVMLFGPAIVALVCNRNGGTLAKGALAKWYISGTITFTAGSTTTGTSVAAFVANEQPGNFLYMLDNASGAGGAPEAECAQITKNTADVITFQPALTTAIANADTGILFSKSQIVAGAGGDERTQTAGIVLAPDGIPDNYWGWVCRKGCVQALMDTTTTVTANRALKAGTGRLAICGGATLHQLTLAHVLMAQTNDVVSDLMVVEFDCWAPQSLAA
jgi:hypothetical protein